MNKFGSTHLTIKDRTIIQEMLGRNSSCIEIADTIHKDPRSISREVKNKREFKTNNKWKNKTTDCKTLFRFPYCCNGCIKKKTCMYPNKAYYNAAPAQQLYEKILKDSRTGMDITPEQKEQLDNLLNDLVGDKDQSLYSVAKNNPDLIHYSTNYLYSLVNQQKLGIKRYELRRAPTFKPRKHNQTKVDLKEIRKDRTYIDFVKYIHLNHISDYVEMDTVESVRDGKHKCLLTLLFVPINFMLIYILESRTKDNVTTIFRQLQETLGEELYSHLFRVVVTDRGSEFCNPEAIEHFGNSKKRIANVFFCDPRASYQKGSLERNHELIRYIIPKGLIFDYLEQNTVDLIASHINCYTRRELGTSPYYLFEQIYGDDTIKLLNIDYIQPNKIVLNSSLLNKK